MNNRGFNPVITPLYSAVDEVLANQFTVLVHETMTQFHATVGHLIKLVDKPREFHAVWESQPYVKTLFYGDDILLPNGQRFYLTNDLLLYYFNIVKTVFHRSVIEHILSNNPRLCSLLEKPILENSIDDFKRALKEIARIEAQESLTSETQVIEDIANHLLETTEQDARRVREEYEIKASSQNFRDLQVRMREAPPLPLPSRLPAAQSRLTIAQEPMYRPRMFLPAAFEIASLAAQDVRLTHAARINYAAYFASTASIVPLSMFATSQDSNRSAAAAAQSGVSEVISGQGGVYEFEDGLADFCASLGN